MSITPIGGRLGFSRENCSQQDGSGQKVTTATLREQKLRHEPITCITAYDYAAARLVDQAGVDMVLVGDSLAQTMLAFTDALRLQSYALYVFDYGAPTGFRLAMARPERVTAIVSQNGNAYEEGLGDAWAPIRQYWANPTTANREILRGVFTLDGIRREYHMGMSAKQEVAPESYTLDAALITRTGNVDIQLDLFLDYANNVKMYPEFHRYFRASRPPLLAIWGKNDPYFIPPGAEAFRRDIPNATVQLLDTGHFALETHINDIANAMSDFLAKHLGSARAATA